VPPPAADAAVLDELLELLPQPATSPARDSAASKERKVVFMLIVSFVEGRLSRRPRRVS
jgi:hypothetical protein